MCKRKGEVILVRNMPFTLTNIKQCVILDPMSHFPHIKISELCSSKSLPLSVTTPHHVPHFLYKLI